ncbi:MAG: hypothetical protein ACRDDY_16180 [Clostridium sp.]|uniref:hypothetical protein n=1 Tax=Clostridium sp. TaxID=1506 RepID=UPI003EE59632
MRETLIFTVGLIAITMIICITRMTVNATSERISKYDIEEVLNDILKHQKVEEDNKIILKNELLYAYKYQGIRSYKRLLKEVKRLKKVYSIG